MLFFVALGTFACTGTACSCCFSCTFPDTKSHEKTNHSVFLWCYILVSYWCAFPRCSVWAKVQLNWSIRGHTEGIMMPGHNANNSNTYLEHSKWEFSEEYSLFTCLLRIGICLLIKTWLYYKNVQEFMFSLLFDYSVHKPLRSITCRKGNENEK